VCLTVDICINSLKIITGWGMMEVIEAEGKLN